MAKTNATKINSNKECFIISPLGADDSETRRKADGLINSVLKPIVIRNMQMADFSQSKFPFLFVSTGFCSPASFTASLMGNQLAAY